MQEKQYLEVDGGRIPIHRQIKLEISAEQLREQRKKGVPLGETVVHAVLQSHGLFFENLSYSTIERAYSFIYGILILLYLKCLNNL